MTRRGSGVMKTKGNGIGTTLKGCGGIRTSREASEAKTRGLRRVQNLTRVSKL